MKAFVIIATKGRAKETYVLFDYLARQTLLPSRLLVIGSETVDVAGLEKHPLMQRVPVEILLSPAGSSTQRNAGLNALIPHVSTLPPQEWLAVFFDDDFRPAQNWLENAARAMQEWRELVGLTGHVLADGISTEFGIPEQDAPQYLCGAKPAERHWSNTPQTRLIDGLYGCNMAFRGTVLSEQRFDEQLPLYGWQEDYDFANRARRYGVLAIVPACNGVHLGASSGRTSGLRFGYSQIANPVYLVRKGTMPWRKAGQLISRNIIANLTKTVLGVRIKDFPGRLRGNLRALLHLSMGKLSPLRVLEL